MHSNENESGGKNLVLGDLIGRFVPWLCYVISIKMVLFNQKFTQKQK